MVFQRSENSFENVGMSLNRKKITTNLFVIFVFFSNFVYEYPASV